MLDRRFRFMRFAGMLIVITSQAAAQQGDLRLLPPKGAPLVVELKSKSASGGKIWEGTGEVLVLNHSKTPQRVQLGYVVSSTGTILPVTKSTATPKSTDIIRLSVTLTKEPPTELPPGGATEALMLTFRTPHDSKLTAMTGLLLLRGDRTAGFENAVPVSFVPPDPVKTNAFSPTKVTLNLTQLWPGFSPDSTFEWPKAHRLTWNSAAAAIPQTEWLASDQGGRLKVEAKARSKDKPGQDFILEASSIGGAGSYTGDLALVPEDPDAPKLAVTVNVQHFFLWPLLTILVGCWGAAALLRRREIQRPKELLRARIKTIGDTYASARKTPSDNISRLNLAYDYDAAFPDVGTYPRGRVAASVLPTLPYAARLYAEVNNADRREDLTAVATRIDEFAVCVADWSGLQSTLGELRIHFEDLKNFMTTHKFLVVQGAYPAVETVRTSIFDLQAPTTAKELTAQKDAVELADKFLGELRQGQAAYSRAETTYNELKELGHEEAVRHIDLPVTFHEAYSNAAGHEQLVTGTQLIGQVEAKLLQIAGKAPAHDDAPADSVFYTTALAGASVRINTADDPRSAQDIMWEVRRMDRFDFWAAFTLAVVTHFITVYDKATFGAWHEYLTAFLFGLAGTLLVKGASLSPILPWQQSMRYAVDKAT